MNTNCFIAGTEITLFDGTIKNIEDVVVGDEVLSLNKETGEHSIGIVGELKEESVTSVIQIVFDDSTTIKTTSEHPFFIKEKEWVNAGELYPDDICIKVSGEESPISEVIELEESHTVYNLLSVSDHSNFYANGILVHNK